MVIVKISGGLGNQLFQYAFGVYIANTLNVVVKYDIQTKLSIRDFTVRNFGLESLELDIATQEEINKNRIFSVGFLSRIERKLVLLFPLSNRNYLIERGIHKFMDYCYLNDNCYYDGYWQCLQYASLINKNSLFNTLFFNPNESIINQIQNLESISIHIRRGDYISIKKNKEIYHICEIDYYTSAIDYISSKCIRPMFFIFSDDIEWAKKNFSSANYMFVNGNEPLMDLYLMSLCKHNIIANSTFSWWAAWFNTYSNKIVTAPAKWYKGNLNDNMNEFIPKAWIRL